MTFTPAIAALVLTGVGGAVSVIGQLQAAQAQAAALQREADIAERNSKIAEQDRIQAIKSSQIAAEDKRRRNAALLSEMRANIGSSGLEYTGSPLDVLQASSTEMALDERRIEYEGKVAGRNKALEILGFKESADASRASASNAKTAGYISAFGSLVETGASIAKIKAGG